MNSAALLAWWLNQNLNPEALQMLQPLQHQAFTIELEDWQKRFRFVFDGQQFQAQDDEAAYAFVLRGNLAGFIQWRSGQAQPQARLHFEGDVYRAQALQQALQKMNPNWEALLGVPMAQALKQLQTQAMAWAAQHYVRREEFEAHRQAIQSLRERLAKL